MIMLKYSSTTAFWFLRIMVVESICSTIAGPGITSVSYTHLDVYKRQVQITGRIFDMITDIAARRQTRALEKYYDLMALKEPPMRILFLIARQFNQLLIVKELAASGRGKDEIAKKAGDVYKRQALGPQWQRWSKEHFY